MKTENKEKLEMIAKKFLEGYAKLMCCANCKHMDYEVVNRPTCFGEYTDESDYCRHGFEEKEK